MASLLFALLKLPLFFLLEIIYFVFRCRPNKDIKNQHIVITGAGQGIGAEFARQFAEMGNTVHCVDIEEKLVKGVVEELKGKGHQAYAYTCDLTKHEQVHRLFNEITCAGFVINVLVNNAGVAFGKELTDMSLTQIQHSLTVNIVSNLWLIKLFLPKMLELNEGHIVNIASLAGFFPVINSTDYCAAKAGSIHAMNQLRMQYSRTNVMFSVVCPFFVRTKMITGINDSIAMSAKYLVTNVIQGIRENRECIIVPGWTKILMIMQVVIPSPIMHLIEAFASGMDKVSSKEEALKFVGQRMAEKIKAESWESFRTRVDTLPVHVTHEKTFDQLIFEVQ